MFFWNFIVGSEIGFKPLWRWLCHPLVHRRMEKFHWTRLVQIILWSERKVLHYDKKFFLHTSWQRVLSISIIGCHSKDIFRLEKDEKRENRTRGNRRAWATFNEAIRLIHEKRSAGWNVNLKNVYLPLGGSGAKNEVEESQIDCYCGISEFDEFWCSLSTEQSVSWADYAVPRVENVPPND